MFNGFFEKLYEIYITNSAYTLLLDGLKYTMIISLLAVVIGILLGAILAVFKVIPRNNIFAKIFTVIGYKGDTLNISNNFSYYHDNSFSDMKKPIIKEGNIVNLSELE